jgi:SagB-type dehydrogenase family enzyme
MNDSKENVGFNGEIFQQKSKNVHGVARSQSVSDTQKPDIYKTYQNALSRIPLPEPQFSVDIPFWDTIKNRHTTRAFSNKPLSMMELSLLLFGTSGLTRKFPKFAFRTVPSAGALFPIESYVVINNVSELKQGIYHYDIENHSLEFLKEGDFQKILSDACYGQRMVAKSAINFIWTAVIERTRNTYAERAYRYIYIDCGHIGQNFYLVAEALGLNACVVGAYYDDDINEFLDLDENKEFAIYMGIVGKSR